MERTLFLDLIIGRQTHPNITAKIACSLISPIMSTATDLNICGNCMGINRKRPGWVVSLLQGFVIEPKEVIAGYFVTTHQGSNGR